MSLFRRVVTEDRLTKSDKFIDDKNKRILKDLKETFIQILYIIGGWWKIYFSSYNTYVKTCKSNNVL